MTLTKMECPNCHGTLEIPEGMKEGFVTCEYCKTKVYIEPTKPNITQNIHIDNVNMGQPRICSGFGKSFATVRKSSYSPEK